MNKITGKNEQKVLEKRSTLFNKNQTEWIDIDFTDWGTIGSKDHRFELIKKSILNNQVIQFIYYNSYGEEKNRKVEPLQIYFKDKYWYLKAYENDKEDYRLFKISRMKDIKVLEEKFQRKIIEQKSEKIKKQRIKIVSLELEISRQMSFRVYDEFKKESIRIKENGDFLVKVEYPENDWVYGYILSFGEHIKVISPKHIREGIKKKLEKSLNNYVI